MGIKLSPRPPGPGKPEPMHTKPRHEVLCCVKSTEGQEVVVLPLSLWELTIALTMALHPPFLHHQSTCDRGRKGRAL